MQAVATPVEDGDVRVRLSAHGMGKVGFALLGVIAAGLFVKFVLSDGGSVIFTVLMAWFAAIVIEPLVRRMSRHMRRGAATGL
ncbi:MAG: AI-2E family transporter, partial [Dermatophilaceae bacterium]